MSLVENLESGVSKRNAKKRPTYLTTRVIMQAFTMTFLAEWGDRSQLTTIILAASKVKKRLFLSNLLWMVFFMFFFFCSLILEYLRCGKWRSRRALHLHRHSCDRWSHGGHQNLCANGDADRRFGVPEFRLVRLNDAAERFINSNDRDDCGVSDECGTGWEGRNG